MSHYKCLAILREGHCVYQDLEDDKIGTGTPEGTRSEGQALRGECSSRDLRKNWTQLGP